MEEGGILGEEVPKGSGETVEAEHVLNGDTTHPKVAAKFEQGVCDVDDHYLHQQPDGRETHDALFVSVIAAGIDRPTFVQREEDSPVARGGSHPSSGGSDFETVATPAGRKKPPSKASCGSREAVTPRTVQR